MKRRGVVRLQPRGEQLVPRLLETATQAAGLARGAQLGHLLVQRLVEPRQFLEGGCCSQVKLIPKDREAGLKRVKQYFAGRFKAVADKYRKKLIEQYGQEKGKNVQYAEAFEVCEYGSQPSQRQLKQLFPFYGN